MPRLHAGALSMRATRRAKAAGRCLGPRRLQLCSLARAFAESIALACDVHENCIARRHSQFQLLRLERRARLSRWGGEIRLRSSSTVSSGRVCIHASFKTLSSHSSGNSTALTSSASQLRRQWISRQCRERLRRRHVMPPLIIASPLELACRLNLSPPVIGINHGIHWDSPNNRRSVFNLSRFRLLFNALDVVSRCVCVDTNFGNWLQCLDGRALPVLEYIPKLCRFGAV